jgi:hypothetical protein
MIDWLWAITVRKVVIEKLQHNVLVDLMNIQLTVIDPAGKMPNTRAVTTDGTGGVAALTQVLLESIKVRRQLAVDKPVI